MKKCPNCQNVYEDSKTFCPQCGVALIDATDTPTVSPVATPEKTKNEFMQKWGGILVSILGLALCWWFNVIIGSAIAIVAALQAWRSNNPLNKYGTAVLAVICTILTIWTIIVG